MTNNVAVARYTDNEVLWRLECIRRLESQQKELEAQIETLKDEVKAEMTARGVDELAVNVFRVSWVKQTQRRFDTQEFKSEHKDMYEQYRRPVELRPFRIL